MSLIQEALKRRQEERPETLAAQPPAAVHFYPASVPAPARPAAAPAVVAVRGLCYGVLFLGACAGMLSLYRSYAPREAAPAVPAADPAASAVPAPFVAPPAAPAPSVPAPVAAPGPGELPPAPPEAPAPAAVAEVPAAPAPVEDVGPEVRVTGVLVRPGQESDSAFINGRLVDLGSRVGGVRLVAVKSNGVDLEYEGRQKFVRVGQRPRWDEAE